MNRKIIYLSLLFIVVLGFGYFINQKYYSSSPVVSSPEISPSAILISPTPIPISITPTAETKTSQVEDTAIPNSYLIKYFPFQSQAPFANWDELHEEACEEASIILVQWWQNNKSSISAQTMDTEILKLVDYQESNWGSHRDITAGETAELAEDIYSLSLNEKNISSIEDIKEEIAQDHPVIVPTAGRLLGNPYFTGLGPIYHMLVVIGYDGKNIIVQDVGTKRGDHYKYNQSVFYNAIHDWNGSYNNIESGKKVMLVLSN